MTNIELREHCLLSCVFPTPPCFSNINAAKKAQNKEAHFNSLTYHFK